MVRRVALAVVTLTDNPDEALIVMKQFYLLFHGRILHTRQLPEVDIDPKYGAIGRVRFTIRDPMYHEPTLGTAKTK